MDAHALTNELNDLLSVETRSMLEHLHESTPHVDASTYRIWKDLQSLAHRDTDHAARLSALLSRLNLPERPRPFPQSVGNFHFMTLQRIVPLLVEARRKKTIGKGEVEEIIAKIARIPPKTVSRNDQEALKALAAPFSGCRFCPTGGITAESAPAWLAEEAVLCVGGSWLVARGTPDPDAITAMARRASDLR